VEKKLKKSPAKKKRKREKPQCVWAGGRRLTGGCSNERELGELAGKNKKGLAIIVGRKKAWREKGKFR